MAKVFIIPDTHFPFHSKKALKEVIKLIKKERPTHVIQIGDLLDQYSFSRYAKSTIDPVKERSDGLKAAADMWSTIHKIVPRAKKIQMLGNHDIRFHKRLVEKFPEAESMFGAIYTFPNVKVVSSDRDFVKIDGVVYIHGWLGRSEDHIRHFSASVVHGHRHRPALIAVGKRFSMDVGFLGDEKSLPFNYTISKLTNWRMACGIVNNGQPKLILL